MKNNDEVLRLKEEIKILQKEVRLLLAWRNHILGYSSKKKTTTKEKPFVALPQPPVRILKY
jgi:hypothetical protein